MTLSDLEHKRGELWDQMKAVRDKADHEKRVSTADENKKWDALHDDLEATIEEIRRAKEQEELDAKMAKINLEAERKAHGAEKQASSGESKLDGKGLSFRAGLLGGLHLLSNNEERKAVLEYRAMQQDPDTLGGYLIPPIEWVNDLLQQVRDEVHIKMMSTVIPLMNAKSLGVPSLDTNMADAAWTSELGTGDEDSSLAFGKRELNPHALAKRIKVSNKLIGNSPQSPEAIVRDQMGYKFGVTEEKAYLTGSGVNQPLGVFTASADGISTGRDVSTGNTSTAITADGLMEAFYTLKGQYQGMATWLFHRDAIKMIRKLKDGNGQYLWAPGLAGGQPGTILTRPFLQSEYAPNTFTSGLYVGIIGDFRKYWIVQSMAMQIQRLVELYAVTNQVGFIGRTELDGMPVLEEAFIRVKLG